ncbi:hypothetical protein AALP_AA6G334000 [Arabis alpina]|uniref:CCHC-type domain-containing protein n=1 Tax=Arabis alpina TaxID=50452 RepID=A0A087GTC3_ARAAL|nr:hypothetical protein AALP_AA6G334000 [Arabis alpina]
MPRLWGFGNSVIGRIIGPSKFQFVFQSEEALTSTLQRGPWSFNEWMLVLQRSIPNLPEENLKFIPFWIRIRGIPPLFLSHETIDFIGRLLGPVLHIDFDESSSRVDFVRVQVNWNIEKPLRFQRNFVFGGENVIVKFWYERLRNFCTKCGLLSHEAKECPLVPTTDEVPQDPDADDDHEDGVQPQQDMNSLHDYLPMEPMSAELPSPITNFQAPPNDHDLAVETVRYIQAKMAKGKFTEEDFMTTFAAYTHQEETSAPHKRKRQVFEPTLISNADETNRMVLNPIVKRHSPCESSGSCTITYPHYRGAGAPVPPLFQ